MEVVDFDTGKGDTRQAEANANGVASRRGFYKIRFRQILRAQNRHGNVYFPLRIESPQAGRQREKGNTEGVFRDVEVKARLGGFQGDTGRFGKNDAQEVDLACYEGLGLVVCLLALGGVQINLGDAAEDFLDAFDPDLDFLNTFREGMRGVENLPAAFEIEINAGQYVVDLVNESGSQRGIDLMRGAALDFFFEGIRRIATGGGLVKKRAQCCGGADGAKFEKASWATNPA